MITLRLTTATLAALALTGGSLSPAHAAPAAPPARPLAPVVSSASPDFDGDGKVDVATRMVSRPSTSGLTIRYGSGTTVTKWATDLVHHTLVHMEGDILARDFNLDGYCDLAFVIGDEIGFNTVYLTFGSATGLQLDALHGIPFAGRMNPENHSFGKALALIESPVLRLAVGGDDFDYGNGAVALYDLGPDGLPSAEPVVVVPGEAGVAKLDRRSQFGSALASTGNLLFVGAPGATFSHKTRAGAIMMLALGDAGVSTSRVITQSTKGVSGKAGKSDDFGRSIAARDGYLVVGAPYDDVKVKNTGSVQVFRIAAGKLTPVKRIAQSSRGVPGADEKNDAFGASVAIGSLCGGVPAVIIGAPGEKIRWPGAGSVWVLPLVKADCGTFHLYESNWIPQEPSVQRRIGSDVAVVRDGQAQSDDLVVIAGSGTAAYAGAYVLWSHTNHGTLDFVEENTWGIAGR